MPDSPSILTLILNYRTPDLTLKAATVALREMRDLRGEVLIIDNGSGDGSYETLQHEARLRGWLNSGRVRVVSSGRNGGFGAGMNFGMRLGLANGATPDFYYLLNSDAWPEPGGIRSLRDHLVSTPKAGLAGSHVRGVDAEPHRTAFRFPSICGEFEMAARTGLFSRLFRRSITAMPIPTQATQVDWTAGASLMLRTEVIKDIGGFDEEFFLYFEETDLCRRAAQAGWQTWYVPDSTVIHVGSASTGMNDWGRTPTYWLDSRLHYFCKSHGTAYAVTATAARTAGGAIYELRRLLQGKPQADPDRFLRDLCGHCLRTLSRPIEDEISPAPQAVKDR